MKAANATARKRRWSARFIYASSALVLCCVAYLAIPLLLTSFGGRVSGERLERVRRSPQYEDGKFRNAIATSMMSPGSLMRTLWLQFAGDEVRVPPVAPAVEERSTTDYLQAPASGLRATWLGHASTLIEIDGARIMTDPIFAERCSPVSFAGPRRFHPPPIPIAALPPIDAVVISHDHFDHLDRAAVTTLAARGTKIVVPLGVGAHLEAWGVAAERFVELDWWQSHEIAGVTITATPSRHYSGRFPGRTDETLWASWAVVGGKHRVFFSGDTGYAPSFREVGTRLGPFDLTIVKIGAYGETWPKIHVTPEEAVQIHRDVRGRVMLPVHWGTFNLAFHRWNEPADRVVAAAAAARIALVVPRPGQWFEPNEARQPPQSWWH